MPKDLGVSLKLSFCGIKGMLTYYLIYGWDKICIFYWAEGFFVSYRVKDFDVGTREGYRSCGDILGRANEILSMISGFVD